MTMDISPDRPILEGLPRAEYMYIKVMLNQNPAGFPPLRPSLTASMVHSPSWFVFSNAPSRQCLYTLPTTAFDVEYFVVWFFSFKPATISCTHIQRRIREVKLLRTYQIM